MIDMDTISSNKINKIIDDAILHSTGEAYEKVSLDVCFFDKTTFMTNLSKKVHDNNIIGINEWTINIIHSALFMEGYIEEECRFIKIEFESCIVTVDMEECKVVKYTI